MNDFVRQMHTRSGLINEWENGLSLAEAEQKVTEYVLRFTPEGVRPLLAGNTIGSDKKFLDHYMPNLMSHLHYRSVDVSTFKELARRWYPPCTRTARQERWPSCSRRHHRVLGRAALLP